MKLEYKTMSQEERDEFCEKYSHLRFVVYKDEKHKRLICFGCGKVFIEPVEENDVDEW